MEVCLFMYDIRITLAKIENLNNLYHKIFEKFENNYQYWTCDDLEMWFKSVNNCNFLVENFLTIQPLIEKNKITGKTLEQHLNYKILTENDVFGEIYIQDRQKVYFEIKNLFQKCKNRKVSFLFF